MICTGVQGVQCENNKVFVLVLACQWPKEELKKGTSECCALRELEIALLHYYMSAASKTMKI